MAKRITLFIVLLAVIVGGAWYLNYRSRQAPAPAAPPTASGQGATPAPVQPAPAPAVPTTSRADRALQVAAMTFAERYGTFSTDAPYENITRLTSLVTPSFAQELAARITSAVATGAGGYYGVTTRALSAVIETASGASAGVKVSTQRQESFNRQGAPRLTYQALNLTLDHSSGTWLVAGARWEK